MTDLAEHASTLITVIGGLFAIIGSLAGICAFLFWRILTRIEQKVEAWPDRCSECKDDFVKVKQFETWQYGRNGPGGLWEAINHHHHAPDGGVVRSHKG